MLRDLNSSLLIELVREARPISRAALARQSGLSAPTVSNIVGRLIERGILVEVATAPANGGRPPVLLDIDATGGYVIGIKLRGDGLTTVVCDLDARVVATDGGGCVAGRRTRCRDRRRSRRRRAKALRAAAFPARRCSASASGSPA